MATRRLRELQRRLAVAGVPLYWFIDVPVDDPRFPTSSSPRRAASSPARPVIGPEYAAVKG